MSVAEKMDDSEGWRAELNLSFAYKANKTILASSKHLGPLRVQRPFYPEDEVCHVYLLHPPGGVVGSDVLNIDIETKEKSHALITTPGSTKFYRSMGEFAKVTQTLNIGNNSTLEWFPQDNILFPGAKVKLQTQVNLEQNSCFMGWDICCLGRPANQELFDVGKLDASLRIMRNGKPLLIERQRVFEQRQLHSSSGLRGYPMSAIFLCTNCNTEHVELARTILRELSPNFPVGITLLDDILVLRALGNSSERLRAAMILVWQALRPLLCQKKPILPRIWLT